MKTLLVLTALLFAVPACAHEKQDEKSAFDNIIMTSYPTVTPEYPARSPQVQRVIDDARNDQRYEKKEGF